MESLRESDMQPLIPYKWVQSYTALVDSGVPHISLAKPESKKKKIREFILIGVKQMF